MVVAAHNKKGPLAGITVVTGIVSAFKHLTVRHDLAMTDEITIMGQVLAVGSVQTKLLAAIDAGVKTVILPVANTQDVRYLPDYITCMTESKSATSASPCRRTY